MMRRLLLASTASLALSASAAFAGGVAEPAVAPAAVEQATTASSAGGYVVPLILLLVLAAAVAGSSGSTAAAPPAPSDIRLKTDISKVGTTHLGLPLYQFRYHDLPEVYEGVMAQDVAVLHPSAIKTLPYGYMAVDYAKLGLQMRRVA